MTAARPCDRMSATILAFEAEMTALGLLPPGDGAAPPPARQGPGRKATQPHGTAAGYRRHRRAREPACAHCADAYRAYQRAYDAARKAS